MIDLRFEGPHIPTDPDIHYSGRMDVDEEGTGELDPLSIDGYVVVPAKFGHSFMPFALTCPSIAGALLLEEIAAIRLATQRDVLLVAGWRMTRTTQHASVQRRALTMVRPPFNTHSNQSSLF